MDKIKALARKANNPGSVWATIAFIAAAAITAWQDGGNALRFSVETEASHYDAITDLRVKVDAIHELVQEHDKTIDELADMATAPGGPAQPAPPSADAGATEPSAADAGTADDAGATAKPEAMPEAKPKKHQQDRIKWSPIQRPSVEG